MSLPYSTTLLNVTIIHSCPFCALNFTFAWQTIIVYFLLCQTPTINVQADFLPIFRQYRTCIATPYLNVISDVCTMHKAQAATHQIFPQTSQSSPYVQLAMLQGAARHDFFVKSLLHFCKFLVNPNFDLETNYIFRKPANRRLQ